MLETQLCPARVLSPFREESGDEELSVLPRHTKVIVTGNNRTKSVLLGLQGVVKKAVGLGGWHWLVLKNGVEVKLQRNALSVLEAPTGDEEDDDYDFDDSSSGSDLGEKENHHFATGVVYRKVSKPRVRYTRPWALSGPPKTMNRGNCREVEPNYLQPVVLNNATVETDNPDLRDRAYIIYWRLLSTDPEAAKDVVLAEKPVISDDSNQLDPSLLDELLSNIATLSSVYHKPPESFVTRVKTTQKTEEEEYPDAGEQSYSDSPARVAESGVSPPASTANPQHPAARQPAAPAALPDLLDLGMDNSNSAIVSVDQPATPAGPPLPVVLPASSGQGLQISAQLIRRDGQVFYSMMFENNSQVPLDGFMIQFNKNTFGLAAGGQLQVPQLLPGTSASTLLPMVLFQNISPGPANTLLQVAIKNNQQPVWYFNDKIYFHVLFTEDGRMERSTFLETWKSLPDSNEVSRDFPASVINSVETTLDRLAASNMFFIAKRKHANQEVLYLSAKIPRGIPFLIELTTVIGTPGVKCAIKTPSPEMAPLFFEAVETLLKS